MQIIAYYRVSTKRQGLSGLGLEGQREAVEAYASQHGVRSLPNTLKSRQPLGSGSGRNWQKLSDIAT